MELDAILKQGMPCGSQNVRLKASSSIWTWVEVLNPRPTAPNPSKAAFKQDPHMAMDRPAMRHCLVSFRSYFPGEDWMSSSVTKVNVTFSDHWSH